LKAALVNTPMEFIHMPRIDGPADSSNGISLADNSEKSASETLLDLVTLTASDVAGKKVGDETHQEPECKPLDDARMIGLIRKPLRDPQYHPAENPFPHLEITPIESVREFKFPPTFPNMKTTPCDDEERIPSAEEKQRKLDREKQISEGSGGFGIEWAPLFLY
jgi:hypothetical protein